jgi:penicillin-binding protein 2
MRQLSSQPKDSWLSWFLRGLLIFLFLVLIGKLFEVQIIKGDYFRALAEENRVRHIPLPAPRGRILSSSGEELVGNVSIKKKVEFKGNGAVALSDDLTNASTEDIVTDYKRYYPLGEIAGHITGYLGEVNEKQIDTVNPLCPEKGTRLSGLLVGLTGLEAEYECVLSGIPGEKLIEVDTLGREIRTLAIKNPTPGGDIKTSVNIGLQKEVASSMDKKGAVIVTDPTGQVLAFYSYPSYDPGLFMNSEGKSKVSALLTNPDLPLFNRVISGTFHPGSVFKPLVTLAALEEGAIDKNFTYVDTGIITVNGFSYTNWYFTEFGKQEGTVDLVKALARSTDTFFYKIGEMLGPGNIAKWSSLFYLDSVTGIDIPGEAKGLIPTPEWKKKTINESWFLGNTYNTSIGQGDVSVTPIEINSYIQAISVNGKFCPPHFAVRNFPCKQIEVRQKNLDLVKEGMKAACSLGGTAYTFFDFPEKHDGKIVACKTGTAEVGADGNPHAWFTFFAPLDNPQIIATVLLEKGGQGSSIAGPVARKIADYYFSNQ